MIIILSGVERERRGVERSMCRFHAQTPRLCFARDDRKGFSFPEQSAKYLFVWFDREGGPKGPDRSGNVPAAINPHLSAQGEHAGEVGLLRYPVGGQQFRPAAVGAYACLRRVNAQDGASGRTQLVIVCPIGQLLLGIGEALKLKASPVTVKLPTRRYSQPQWLPFSWGRM